MDYTPKTGKKRSAIWHFFTPSGINRAKCDNCMAAISISGGSTANLIRHIRKKHPEFYVSTVRPKSEYKSELATIILAPSDDKVPTISHIEEVQDGVQDVVQEVIHGVVDEQTATPAPASPEVHSAPGITAVSRPNWIYNTKGPEIVRDILVVLFVLDAPAVVAEAKLRLYNFGNMNFGKKYLAKLLIDMCKCSNLTSYEFSAFGINVIRQFNSCECDGGQRILKHDCEFLRFMEFCKMIRESDDENFVELVENYSWIDSEDMDYFIFK